MKPVVVSYSLNFHFLSLPLPVSLFLPLFQELDLNVYVCKKKGENVSFQ